MGVLDRQVVELELLLHVAEELLFRLVQADPDEPLLLSEGVLDVPDVDVGHSPPIGVDRAVHHARRHRDRILGRRSTTYNDDGDG
jgi:hypothetical protein